MKSIEQKMLEKHPKVTCLLAQYALRRVRLYYAGKKYRVTYYNNERKERKYKYMKVLINTENYDEALEVWQKNAEELVYGGGK